MKQIVEVSGQGIEALLGEKVTFMCMNYFYHGKLVGVNETDLLLEDAYIVYETGSFTEEGFKDAQYIAKQWRVRIAAIESYGAFKGKTK